MSLYLYLLVSCLYVYEQSRFRMDIVISIFLLFTATVLHAKGW